MVGTDLLEFELVAEHAEHALAVLAHPGLPALPAGAEQGGHLLRPQQRRHLVLRRAAIRRLLHKHSILNQVFVGPGGYLNMEC